MLQLRIHWLIIRFSPIYINYKERKGIAFVLISDANIAYHHLLLLLVWKKKKTIFWVSKEAYDCCSIISFL
jgi:hypothetical protein